jgi:glycosyltransferase involved in cell wall biosynthesis
MSRVPICLATFVKNEAHCIEHMFKSVVDHVDEIVVVDTGSTDGTQDICKKYVKHIYETPFTDFGKIRTLTMRLATTPWVLMLDADETIERPDLLQEYLSIHERDGLICQ